MARYIITAKVGNNGVSFSFRDSRTGEVGSGTVMPKAIGQGLLEALKEHPDCEVKVE